MSQGKPRKDFLLKCAKEDHKPLDSYSNNDLMENIRLEINSIKESLDEPALILMYEDDYNKLSENILFLEKDENGIIRRKAIFGVEIVVIPRYLEFNLAKNHALVIPKKIYDLIRKSIEGK